MAEARTLTKETEAAKAPPTNIIQVIERAALNPNIDVEKMERLLAMQERIIDREAKQEFSHAMNACQTAMEPIAADARNPQTKSKYASYQALDKVLRPIYTEHGFSLTFNTAEGAPENNIRVVCDVLHGSGCERRYQADMPADGKGAKGGDVMTKTHAAGSAMTYGMRYLLKMIFNVTIGEDDDDGNKGGTEKISPEQADELLKLADDLKVNKVLFCKYHKVKSFHDLSAANFNAAKAAIEKKGASNDGTI